MEESELETGVSLWSEVMAFEKSGLAVSYEGEMDSDDFIHFALQLRKYWSKPFLNAAEEVKGDEQICVATPKPSELNFREKCAECSEEISNEDIHFEVSGEDTFLFICRDCFLEMEFGE